MQPNDCQGELSSDSGLKDWGWGAADSLRGRTSTIQFTSGFRYLIATSIAPLVSLVLFICLWYKGVAGTARDRQDSKRFSLPTLMNTLSQTSSFHLETR